MTATETNHFATGDTLREWLDTPEGDEWSDILIRDELRRWEETYMDTMPDHIANAGGYSGPLTRSRADWDSACAWERARAWFDRNYYDLTYCLEYIGTYFTVGKPGQWAEGKDLDGNPIAGIQVMTIGAPAEIMAYAENGDEVPVYIGEGYFRVLARVEGGAQ